MEERAYEHLEDGSIAIAGLNIEARINTQGIVYDVNGVEFGELTEDKSKVLLWDDSLLAKFGPMYEVEIYPGKWVESDGSDLFDEEENSLTSYDPESLPEDLGDWWHNSFTEPPKPVRRRK